MPNRRRELIAARLKHVRNWLDSTLEQVPEGLVDWGPGTGMRTLGGQIVEIIEIEIPLVPRLRDGRHPSEEEIAAAVGDPHDMASLKQALKNVRAGTLAYLDTLSDEALAEEVTLDQYYGTLHLPTMPRAEHFLNVSEHEFYHVGQLISYLWTRGDDPYKW